MLSVTVNMTGRRLFYCHSTEVRLTRVFWLLATTTRPAGCLQRFTVDKLSYISHAKEGTVDKFKWREARAMSLTIVLRGACTTSVIYFEYCQKPFRIGSTRRKRVTIISREFGVPILCSHPFPSNTNAYWDTARDEYKRVNARHDICCALVAQGKM